MHHVILVIVVWFVSTAGVDRPQVVDFAAAPDGTTLAECRAQAKLAVAEARKIEGVSDAAADCVEVVQRLSS